MSSLAYFSVILTSKELSLSYNGLIVEKFSFIEWFFMAKIPFLELEGFLDNSDSGDCELEPATGSLRQDLLSPLLVSQVEGFPVYDVASSLCENRVN